MRNVILESEASVTMCLLRVDHGPGPAPSNLEVLVHRCRIIFLRP